MLNKVEEVNQNIIHAVGMPSNFKKKYLKKGLDLLRGKEHLHGDLRGLGPADQGSHANRYVRLRLILGLLKREKRGEERVGEDKKGGGKRRKISNLAKRSFPETLWYRSRGESEQRWLQNGLFP